MPQLDPTFYPAHIAWLVVCFGTLWALMHWKIMPRFDQLRTWRKKALHDLIDEAKDLQKEAERILKENHHALEVARREAAQLIQEAKEASEQNLAHCLEEARTAYNAQMKELKEKLVQEEADFHQKMDQAALELSHLILDRFGLSSSAAEGEELRG